MSELRARAASLLFARERTGAARIVVLVAGKPTVVEAAAHASASQQPARHKTNRAVRTTQPASESRRLGGSHNKKEATSLCEPGTRLDYKGTHMSGIERLGAVRNNNNRPTD